MQKKYCIITIACLVLSMFAMAQFFVQPPVYTGMNNSAGSTSHDNALVNDNNRDDMPTHHSIASSGNNEQDLWITSQLENAFYSDSATVTPGIRDTINVLANDDLADCSADITVSILRPATRGTTTITADNQITYLATDFKWYGVDSLKYLTTCTSPAGTLSDSAMVYIAIVRPYANAYQACPGSSITVEMLHIANMTFQWYAGQTGGTSLATSDSLTITIGVTDTTVWVEPHYNDNGIIRVYPRYPVNVYLSPNCGTGTGCLTNGRLLFRETFGESPIPNYVNCSSTPLPAGVTNYIFGNAVNDGFYALCTENGALSNYWYTGSRTYDHSRRDGWGRWMLVNADYVPGKFYTVKIDSLCPETKLYFSSWVFNLMNPKASAFTTGGQNINNYADPDLLFELTDATTGVVLARYVTGEIPKVDMSIGQQNWRQYGFEFTTGGSDSLILAIYNNAPGGNGNDLMLDDIEVRVCTPPISIPANPVACQGTTYTLTASYTDDGTFGNTDLQARIEYSINGQTNWTTVTSGVTTSVVGNTLTLDYTLTPVKLADAGYYRILTGNSGTIDKVNCRAQSDAFLFKVNSHPVVATDTIKRTGPGNVDLQNGITNYNTGYTYQYYDNTMSQVNQVVNVTATGETDYFVKVANPVNGCDTTVKIPVLIRTLDGAMLIAGSPDTVCLGSEATFTVKITNQSNPRETTQNIVVENTFGSGLQFVSATSGTGTIYNNATRIWNIPALNYGDTTTLVLTFVAVDATPANLTVVSEITSMFGDSLTTNPVITQTLGTHPLPTADFTYVQDGNNTLTIHFTDNSTFPANTGGTNTDFWEWNFGDGGTATEQNPTHTYTVAGNYDVTLKATSDRGCVNTVSKTVLAGVTVAALFNVNDVTQCLDGNSFVVTNRTGASLATDTTYSWNFGDGSPIVTDRNPAPHTYAAPGNYLITLTAAINGGTVVNTRSIRITVYARTTGTITGNPITCSGNTETYTLNTTTAINTYTWTITGNNTISNSTVANPQVTWNQSGTLTLNYVDIHGCTGTASAIVTVNPKPVFTITYPDTTCIGQHVDLTATTSNPQNVISYNYYYANQITLVPDPVNVTVTAIDATYYIQAISNTGCLSDFEAVEVNGYPKPVADFSHYADDFDLFTIDFFDNTSISSGSIVAWNWDFGDNSTSTVQNPTHQYAQPQADYTVTLTATSDNACTDIVSYRIHVGDSLDVAFEINDTIQCLEGNIFIFKNLSTAGLSEIALTTYLWTFGDGDTSTLKSPLHHYTTAGVYDVKLVVTVGTLKDSSTVQVTVNPMPNLLSKRDTTLCIGENIDLNNLITTDANTTGIFYTAIGGLPLNTTIVSPTDTTTYYIGIISSVTPCETWDSVTVNVNALPVLSSKNDTTICQGESVDLTGLVTSDANSNAAFYTAMNGTVINPPNVSPSDTTQYYVLLTNPITTCTLWDSVTVNATPLPALLSKRDTTICNGERVNLNDLITVDNATMFTFYPSISGSPLSNIVVMPSDTTMYYVAITNISTDCASWDSVRVNVNPLPVKSDILSVVNDTICAGQTATVTATATTGNTPVWYSDPALTTQVETGNTFTTPILNSNTTYYVVARNNNTGCQAIAGDTTTVTVQVNIPPEFITCPGDITALVHNNRPDTTVTYIATASGIPAPAFTYQFSGATTGNGTGTGSSSVFNKGITNVIITASNSCGTAECNFTVTVRDTINPCDGVSATLSGDTSVCEGLPANLTITFTGTGPWNVTYSDGVDERSLDNITQNPYLFTVNPVSTTVYTLTGISTAACTSGSVYGTASVVVNPLPVLPVLQISGNVNIYKGKSTTLTVMTPVDGTVRWYADESTNNLLNEGLSYTTPALNQTTMYYLRLVNSAGCESAEVQAVTVYVQNPDIYIPGAITPNNDGQNDDLIIPGIEQYPNNVFQIFNRWGDLVYKKPGYNNQEPWNGYSNVSMKVGSGKIPTGTYYYIMELNDDNKTILKGFIEVRY